MIEKGRVGALHAKKSSEGEPKETDRPNVQVGSAFIDNGLNTTFLFQSLKEILEKKDSDTLAKMYRNVHFFDRLTRRMNAYDINVQNYQITGKKLPEKIQKWWETVKSENQKDQPDFRELARGAYEAMTDKTEKVPNNYEIFGKPSERKPVWKLVCKIKQQIMKICILNN